MSLIQHGIVDSLLYVLSFIYYYNLSKTQTVQLLICVVSLSCLSSPFLFPFALSTHFSTTCVYGIVIIESYASLPLHTPYVAHSVFLSPSLFCLRGLNAAVNSNLLMAAAVTL